MTSNPGVKKLIECLSEQSAARATGVVSIAGDQPGQIFLVFGHPLHATCGTAVGVAAVEAIAEVLESPDRPAPDIAWTAGQTAGNTHSLAVGDQVLDLLRARQSGAGEPAGEGEQWTSVQLSICESLEASLPLSARTVPDSIRAATAEPGALLLAIDRARQLTPRMVATARLQSLLDDAEKSIKVVLAGG